MDNIGILELTMNGLFLILALSLPPIIVASVAGLLVSFLQAVTQIQEQTLSFGVKLVTVMFTIIFIASWIGGEIYNYSANIFNSFPHIVR